MTERERTAFHGAFHGAFHDAFHDAAHGAAHGTAGGPVATMPHAEGANDVRVPPPAEPATGRALWPTFMRRTLTEEALRLAPEPAAAE